MHDYKSLMNKNNLIFDCIADKYDLLNHTLSFGQDIFWRRKVIDFIPDKPDMNLLDLATGTADQLIAILKKCPNIGQATGIDNAKNMLNIARKKMASLKLNKRIRLLKEDITHLKIPANSIDIITISFGIRNIPDFRFSLAEMYRILKKRGILIILEFSIPANKIVRNIYLFYFRHILPKIGSIISGEKKAYYYLNKSVEEFPCGENFKMILNQAGFKKVQMKPLSLGIATIYSAKKIK
jgi:demethylmenaquinone methyltransferase/2-methoxy-6-polyprenyl-1,4-benzoquinol methylase